MRRRRPSGLRRIGAISSFTRCACAISPLCGRAEAPLYVLAGEADDITTKEQAFAAEHLVGTPHSAIVKKMVPGGHIGLFMGSKTLSELWPEIGHWMKRHEQG